MWVHLSCQVPLDFFMTRNGSMLEFALGMCICILCCRVHQFVLLMQAYMKFFQINRFTVIRTRYLVWSKHNELSGESTSSSIIIAKPVPCHRRRSATEQESGIWEFRDYDFKVGYRSWLSIGKRNAAGDCLCFGLLIPVKERSLLFCWHKQDVSFTYQ